jgi:acyl carrier protein
VSSPSDVVVLDLVAKTVQVERNRLTPCTSFQELGLSSFQELELFAAIEHQFGVELNLTQFLGFVDVSQLLESVGSALQGKGLAEAGEQR